MPVNFISEKDKCTKADINDLDALFSDDEPAYVYFDEPYKVIKEPFLKYIKIYPYKEVYLYVNKEEVVAYHVETDELVIPENLLDPHSGGPKKRFKKKEEINFKEMLKMTYTSAVPYLANVNKKKIDDYLAGTYVLTKYELIGLCIALHLSIDNIEKVLMSHGYGLNKTLYRDRLIKALVELNKYDIFLILESVYASNKY